jgi:hypothetical protein
MMAFALQPRFNPSEADMTVVISKIKVDNYEDWHQAWDASRPRRSASGMQSAYVLRTPAAPTCSLS